MKQGELVKKEMIKDNITCCCCKKKFEWEEPKDYGGTEFMPDGELGDGEWTCSECLKNDEKY